MCSGIVQQAPYQQFGTAEVGSISPYQTLGPSPSQIGISFYVQHYLLGYPDEVRESSDLKGVQWFEHSAAQSTMAALGLAALGNLNDDKQLQRLSETQYGDALVKTNEALQDPLKNLETAIRTTVMLALFQVISFSTNHVPRCQFRGRRRCV